MRRYARTLVAVVWATTAMAGTAGWSSGTTQQPLTGPPPGTASWRADHALGRDLPDPARSTPAQVGRCFARLTEDQRTRLAVRHPLVVGNRDGVPVGLRYRANARALKAGHDPRYAHLAAPGRQVLAIDPRGRGRVAEVFGDLRAARHVSVVVPGADIDAGTFDRTTGRPMCTAPPPVWRSPCTRRPAGRGCCSAGARSCSRCCCWSSTTRRRWSGCRARRGPTRTRRRCWSWPWPPRRAVRRSCCASGSGGCCADRPCGRPW